MVHVSNFGKDGGQIFFDKDDYIRFVFSLAYLNTDQSVGKAGNTRHIIKRGYRGFASAPEENQLVSIIAFTLLPKEIHLILRDRKESGISRFMQKVGTGYSVYMNKKLGRAGGIFQGTYKTSVLEQEDKTREVIRGIHFLPAVRSMEGASPEPGTNLEVSEKILAEYPWSSCPDYCGKRSLAFLDHDLIRGVAPDPAGYLSFVIGRN